MNIEDVPESSKAVAAQILEAMGLAAMTIAESLCARSAVCGECQTCKKGAKEISVIFEEMVIHALKAKSGENSVCGSRNN